MDRQAPDSDQNSNPNSEQNQVYARAAQGDEDAWREMVEAFSGRVFGLILKQCGDRELADEITQATFVKIVSNLHRYTEQGRFDAWIFRIAINLLRDEMRRRKRQARTMDMSGGGRGDDGSGSGDNGQWQAVEAKIVGRDGPDGLEGQDPFQKVARQEQVELMRQAIASLNEADQQILYLRHTAGLSFNEIAQTLEQPLGTVLARGHRALGKLKKLMGSQEPQAKK
jgi:RNA polymerase sigma-70 factor (ECF subfamily)